jgi:hypothetical protein
VSDRISVAIGNLQIYVTVLCNSADSVEVAISNTVHALLAEASMFQNRQNGFVPNVGAPSLTPMFPTAPGREQNRSPMAIQIADIYQAAMQRAIEEHEIDKLFNAEYYHRKS